MGIISKGLVDIYDFKFQETSNIAFTMPRKGNLGEEVTVMGHNS